MHIRPYTPQDEQAVLQVLQLNIPASFAREEYNDFKHYLQNEKEDYFVIENHSGIVGAGGINYFIQERKARISWDMIHPHQQGKGAGSQLLQYRLNYLKSFTHIHTIQVRTSQFAYPFYEKNGFSLKNIVKNYWAHGFDLYDMEKENIPLQE